METNWKILGKQKRDTVNALIPKAWLLASPVPSAEDQRDLTGPYIQQFLSPREIEITETDAVGICEMTTSGLWKAREVTEAFCHRASLAHQMVLINNIIRHFDVYSHVHRSTVCMRYSSRMLSMMLKFWMIILRSMVNP